MVKTGGVKPEEVVLAAALTTPPLASPEWTFSLTSRPTMKRAGTPFPERARRELKRSGYVVGSEVTRVKRKMFVEMAEKLVAGNKGEEKKSPEVAPPFGALLGSLAHMAKPGVIEANGNGKGASPTISVQQDHAAWELPAADHELAGALGEDGSNGHMLEGTLCHMLTNSSVESRGVGGHVESSAHACDSFFEKPNNTLSNLHDMVTPSLAAKVDQDSNVIQSHTSTCFASNVTHPAPVAGIVSNTNAGAAMPELWSAPATYQNPAFSPKLDQGTLVTSCVGASLTTADGKSGSTKGDGVRNEETPKPEPGNLETGKVKDVGTAGSREGVPSISFSNEETQILADKIGHAIVGKFSHTIPSPQQIQKSLSNMQFVDGFKWKPLNAKHILIQLKDARDYARMLNGPNGAPVWYIEHHPMRVFKWTPDFDTFFESPIAAVWCKVIGIPIHLYDQSALLAIGKLLGKPIQADHATINQTRLSFARICVEIDISIPPPEEIIINILGKDTRYKVVWDRIPLFCVECKHVGHLKEACITLGKREAHPPRGSNRAHQPHSNGSAPKSSRREWRPKKPTIAPHTSTPVRIAAAKGESEKGNHNEIRGADSTTSSRAPTVPQVQVDEDGFQLVTKRRKGKSTYLLNHVHEGAHKANYLETLLKGSNVATISFGEASVEVIDPGGGSSSLTL